MSDHDHPTIEKLLVQGNDQWHLGQPQNALESYVRAVESITDETPIQTVVTARNSLALCLCEVGDFDAAMPIYEELETLCRAEALDPTIVMRQWAKALEQTGQFERARKTYEAVRPDQNTSQDGRLKWEHAVGLLNWRQGRLSEAAENLAAATAALPQDPVEAAKVLGVLGNDALLAMDLGQFPRAYRLVERMAWIKSKAPAIALSSEVNLVKVRAALASKRGDVAEQAAVLKEGIELIEDRAPDDWMRKLDLAADYVAAVAKSEPSDAPLEFLSALCAKAPPEAAWIGAFILAQLQLEVGDLESVRANIAIVMAAFMGSGAPESEVEILGILARLANGVGALDASIFLGKLTLKNLASMASAFDGAELRKIISAGDDLIAETTRNLEGAGRFEEALVLRNLFERVRRYTLVFQGGGTAYAGTQPVPLEVQEAEMERQWLSWRDRYAAMRETADHDALIKEAHALMNVLFAFQSRSGLAVGAAHRPGPNILRLKVVPKDVCCEVQYLWHDRVESRDISVSKQAFLHRIADLRDGLMDVEAWRDPSRDLFDWVIAPVAEQLEVVDCLEVDCAGLLGRVPVALLFDGTRCLIDRVPVRYVLDVPITAEDTALRSGLAYCSAFASTQNSGDANVRRPLLGSDFTRAALVSELKAKPRYLSVMSHLETEPTRPDLSSLLMGDETPLYLSDFVGDQFDLRGLEVAVVAACSSGVGDTTQAEDTSLAALMLEKGVKCYVGTLWDIPQSAATAFLVSFWQALLNEPTSDPAQIVAQLQSAQARKALNAARGAAIAGGIGHPAQRHTPDGWAAFAVFQSGNQKQPGANPVA